MKQQKLWPMVTLRKCSPISRSTLTSFEKEGSCGSSQEYTETYSRWGFQDHDARKVPKIDPMERHKFSEEHPEEYKELYGGKVMAHKIYDNFYLSMRLKTSTIPTLICNSFALWITPLWDRPA